MGFDRDAELYDKFSSRDYRQEAEMLRKKFPDARTVLEIGAGTGSLTVELEKLGFTVTAVEPSESMRERFKSNSAELYPDTIQMFQGSASGYDIGIAHYDVLNFVPFSDIDSVVSKIYRLCNDVSIEVWDATKPVCLLQRRVSTDQTTRYRLALRWGRRVWLWFFYVKGLQCRTSFHRLYLHSNDRVKARVLR